jgi:ferritin-like metal-binding protein YciE
MNALKNQYLENLFLDELSEMYAGEQDIAKALSRMTKRAANDDLRRVLKAHAYQTVGHISRVAQVFGCFGEATVGMKGNAIPGLLAEAAALVPQKQDSPANDAAIISAVQNVQHYEIATYTCLRDWARMLENDEAAIILEEILDEEKSCDRGLTDLAHLPNLEAPEEAGWHSHAESEDEEALAHHGHGHSDWQCGSMRRHF